MTEWVKDFLLRLTGVSVASLLAELLLPEGKVKKFALFGVSLLLTACLLDPLLSLKEGDFRLPMVQTASAGMEKDCLQKSVEAVVHSFEGFENAEVFISQNGTAVTSVRVAPRAEKMLEKVEEDVKWQEVKRTLKAIYKTEDISLRGS